MWKHKQEDHRITVQASLGKKNLDLISKIPKAKGTGSMAQVVERLPSKYEAQI
jgi:hypothetical protein